MLQDKERSLSEREEKVTRYDVETASELALQCIAILQFLFHTSTASWVGEDNHCSSWKTEL